MSNLNKPNGDTGIVQKQVRSEFLELPPGYQKPAAYFWGFYQHLLPIPTPLIMRLQVWITKQEMTKDEARLLFNALVEPEKEAGYKFASDLLTDMAKSVAEIVRRRKQREEVEQRRKESAVQPDPAANELIRQMIAGIGSKA